MDLAQNAHNGAAALCGVVTTLRRLYRPQFEAEPAFTTALSALQRNEQRALSQIASMARRPAMSGNPA